MTTTTLARCQHTNRADHQTRERLETTPLHDTIVRDETWNCRGCGGWLYQQTELDPEDASRALVTFPLQVTEYERHPAWCEAHAGHEDGSGDWHESREIEIGGFTTQLSAGVWDRTPGVFVIGCVDNTLSIADARALGERLIALCNAAESDQ